MLRFDCLALDCPVFGPHLLEASAGTGKTFSIEHIFTRLILESKQNPIQIEEILAVTFTRAATRELKERIRGTMVKALEFLQTETPWEYLKPYVGSFEAIQILKNSIAIFDRCQIFTIHGFCYRMLQEFAFEARLGFSLQNPDQDKNLEQQARSLVVQFLSEKVATDLVCPEQIVSLFGKFESIDSIALAILRSSSAKGRPFAQLVSEFSSQLKTWIGPHIEEAALLEDFENIRDQYKSQIKGDFEIQIRSLAKALATLGSDSNCFQHLIQEKGSLFRFLSPANKKVRAKTVSPLSYPGFFEWCLSAIAPLVEEASNYKKILACLTEGWKEYERTILVKIGQISPDEILRKMREAVDSPPFAAKLQKRYKAIIVDEFQDTDPLQWEIFQKLFLSSSAPLQASYFVGDPKQSIYRFRSADVYTYIAAKEFLGEKNLYHLDTNFRSSKELIGALNSLFNRNWLSLPKIQSSLPYLPVRAGSKVTFQFPDEKRALHWIVGGPEASFKDTFLPFAVKEIETLIPLFSLSSFAILVKDRYEAQMALDLLRERGIAALARSHEPIGKTKAFQSLRELFSAIEFPESEEKENALLYGPFHGHQFSLADLKNVVLEKGLVSLFAQLPYPEDPDVRQILEELFQWEKREGFSFEGVNQFLERFEHLTAEEGGRRRRDGIEDAVQVITMHISKGLEFDVVFALGLASPSIEDEENPDEGRAESLRQLYVALTRAKKRLYVPISQAAEENSPIHLFAQLIESEGAPFVNFIKSLCENESVSFDHVPTPFLLPPSTISIDKMQTSSLHSIPICPPVQPVFIQSFTSLSVNKDKQHDRTKEPEKKNALREEGIPTGAETGVLVHQIFEKIFQSPYPLWKDKEQVEKIVDEKILLTTYAPWNQLFKELIWESVSRTLSDGTESFSLKDLDPSHVYPEMEFLFAKPPHLIKGFIDLAFSFCGKYYLLDWKTNMLEPPTKERAEEEMQVHDYHLQAALYAEAFRRYLGDQAHRFGGVFYYFVRSGLYLHFYPDSTRLGKLYE